MLAAFRANPSLDVITTAANGTAERACYFGSAALHPGLWDYAPSVLACGPIQNPKSKIENPKYQGRFATG